MTERHSSAKVVDPRVVLISRIEFARRLICEVVDFARSAFDFAFDFARTFNCSLNCSASWLISSRRRSWSEECDGVSERQGARANTMRQCDEVGVVDGVVMEVW